jgi:hypothetical protein
MIGSDSVQSVSGKINTTNANKAGYTYIRRKKQSKENPSHLLHELVT